MCPRVICSLFPVVGAPTLICLLRRSIPAETRVQGLRPQSPRSLPHRPQLRPRCTAHDPLRRRPLQSYVFRLRHRTNAHDLPSQIDPDVPAPLDSSILSAIEDFPVPPDFDKDPDEGKDDKDTSSRAKTLSGTLGGVTPSSDGERKLPKWLKLGPSACLRLICTICLTLTSPIEK